MIGRIERIADGARDDARQGHKRRPCEMTSNEWNVYTRAHRREVLRMREAGKLAQLRMALWPVHPAMGADSNATS